MGIKKSKYPFSPLKIDLFGINNDDTKHDRKRIGIKKSALNVVGIKKVGKNISRTKKGRQ